MSSPSLTFTLLILVPIPAQNEIIIYLTTNNLPQHLKPQKYGVATLQHKKK